MNIVHMLLKLRKVNILNGHGCIDKNSDAASFRTPDANNEPFDEAASGWLDVPHARDFLVEKLT